MPMKTTQDIISNKIIKKGFQKNINNFFNVLNKISKSQKKQMNKAKQILIVSNLSPKIDIISNLDNFDKKTWSNLIQLKKLSISNTKNNDIAMINPNIYYAACYLKKAQVFIIFLKIF